MPAKQRPPMNEVMGWISLILQNNCNGVIGQKRTTGKAVEHMMLYCIEGTMPHYKMTNFYDMEAVSNAFELATPTIRNYIEPIVAMYKREVCTDPDAVEMDEAYA